MSKLKITTRGTIVSLGLAALAVGGIMFAPSSPGLVEHSHTSAAVVHTLHAPHTPAPAPTATHTPTATAVAVAPVECATEDSHNCVWHADQHGNGLGQSFTDVNGTATYFGPDWTAAPCSMFPNVPAYTSTRVCISTSGALVTAP